MANLRRVGLEVEVHQANTIQCSFVSSESVVIEFDGVLISEHC